MIIKILNIDGNKTNNIELSDKIFSVKSNKNVIQSWMGNFGRKIPRKFGGSQSRKRKINYL